MLVVISLTALLAVVAIAVDGGVLLGEKRHAQATADAAALAGASDLFKNWAKYEGSDVNGTAKATALAIADSNGYSNDGTTSTVEIRTAGETYLGGPNAGQPIPQNYFEATVTYYQRRSFSSLFGSGTIPVKARAVARGSWKIPKFGFLVLDPSARSSLSLTGNGLVNVPDGIIWVNSTDDAAVVNTNNGSLTAMELDFAGGISGGGTYTTTPIPDNINYGVPQAADPYAALPAPSVPPDAPKPLKIAKDDPIVTALLANGQLSQTILDAVKNVYLLQPGRYDTTNKLNFQSTDLVIFQQASADGSGIYYLENGLFSQGANLLMDPNTSGGLMFYNAGTGENDKISITGSPNGVVNLSALEAGTYQGVLIFQNRLATQPISITGNGDFSMTGTIYAPNAEVQLTGNGAEQTIGSAIVARYVTVSGNGTINVAYNTGKVAPQRVFQLVE